MGSKMITSQVQVFIFLIIFFLLPLEPSFCVDTVDVVVTPSHGAGDITTLTPLIIVSNSSLSETQKNSNSLEDGKNQESSEQKEVQIPTLHVSNLNPGALMRGFYVFVGLSAVVVAYLLFRSSRVGKNPAQMVRKYGILAHRQDIEMRPLPLDEDDEDDTTVFDISVNLSPQKQHQQLSS